MHCTYLQSYGITVQTLQMRHTDFESVIGTALRQKLVDLMNEQHLQPI